MEQDHADLLRYFLSMNIQDEEAYKDEETRAVLSDKFRRDGNELYKRGGTIEAIKMYTKSIACATNSRDLALAYANRSAALFKIHHFEECLQEIDRALEKDYDKKLMHKLYLRQARCLKFLGRDFEGSLKKCFQAIEKYLDYAEKNGTKKIVAADMEKPAPKLDPKVGEFYPHMPVPPLSYGVNEEIPCLSSAVSLKYSEELGRHLVANRDIEIGDVLIVEEPFATMINPDHAYLVCCKCFKVCFNLIPHKSRHRVLYCSEQCMNSDTDWDFLDKFTNQSRIKKLCDKYLKDELFFGNLDYERKAYTMPFLVISILRKVLKMDSLREVLKTQKLGDPCTSACTEGFTIGKSQTNLKALLSLCDNFVKLTDNQKRYISVFSTNTVVELFPESFSEILNLPQLLATLYLITVFNFKPITIYCNKPFYKHKGTGSLILPICEVGKGLYLGSSFVSHSCEPNLIKVNYGSTCVYRAILSIKKGDVLTESYLYIYRTKDEKSRRQEVLQKHFKFTCECEACVGDWPNLRNNIVMDDDPATPFIIVGMGCMPRRGRCARREFQKVSPLYVKLRCYNLTLFCDLATLPKLASVVGRTSEMKEWLAKSVDLKSYRLAVIYAYLGQGSSIFSKLARKTFTASQDGYEFPKIESFDELNDDENKLYLRFYTSMCCITPIHPNVSGEVIDEAEKLRGEVNFLHK